MNSQPDQPSTRPAVPDIRLTAVVPVYNEQDTIAEIVARLERVPVIHQIVIADDGSIDRTREIIAELAQAGRVDVVLHDRNMGKGAALRSALELVREPYLVIQDADLEYNPQDFLTMVEAIQQYNTAVVYGSRFLGGPRSGMLWTHYLGNRLLTLIFDLMYFQRLTDMETCYKLFRTDLLRHIKLDHNDFDIDPELTAKVTRMGIRIREVPITYVGRTYLAGKKIKPRHAWTAIKTLWHYRRWRAARSLPDPHSATVSH